MVLYQEAPLIVSAHVGHLLQALIDEHLLTPLTVAMTHCGEVILAQLPTPAQSVNSAAGEHLERAMHSKLAIVQVHTSRLLWVMWKEAPQPRGEEYSVRVDLDSPVVARISANVNNPIPDSDENVEVESSPK